MNQNRRSNCDECRYTDRPILIVSTHRFNAEVLGNFLSVNTPAKWSIFERLGDISRPDGADKDSWRLILVDCLGLTHANVMKLLQTEAAPFLQHDIFALFNLTQNNTGIPELIDLGVRGFFFENDQADFILKGICALKNGELWVARSTLMEYVCQRPRKAPPNDHAVIQLTPREKNVLILLASGTTNKEISNRLYISPHTVKTHVYNILKKLGVQNRMQAALWAAKYLK